MPPKDFDAARKERLRQRDPMQFVLQGDVYTCLAIVPVGVAFDLADAPERDEMTEAQAGAEFSRSLASFIDNILIEADRPRFQSALRRRDDPIDPDTLLEIVDWLGQEYSARPTEPSAESSDGRGATGRTSRSAAAKKASRKISAA